MKLITLSGANNMITPIDPIVSMGAGKQLSKRQIKNAIRKLEQRKKQRGGTLGRKKTALLKKLKGRLYEINKAARKRARQAAKIARQNRGKMLMAAAVLGVGGFFLYKNMKRKRR